MQNIRSAPVVYISGNTVLNDFCPLKRPIILASTLPAYSYTYVASSNVLDSILKTISTAVPALTLTNNGNYATTQDALVAVTLCK